MSPVRTTTRPPGLPHTHTVPPPSPHAAPPPRPGWGGYAAGRRPGSGEAPHRAALRTASSAAFLRRSRGPSLALPPRSRAPVSGLDTRAGRPVAGGRRNHKPHPQTTPREPPTPPPPPGRRAPIQGRGDARPQAQPRQAGRATWEQRGQDHERYMKDDKDSRVRIFSWSCGPRHLGAAGAAVAPTAPGGQLPAAAAAEGLRDKAAREGRVGAGAPTRGGAHRLCPQAATTRSGSKGATSRPRHVLLQGTTKRSGGVDVQCECRIAARRACCACWEERPFTSLLRVLGGGGRMGACASLRRQACDVRPSRWHFRFEIKEINEMQVTIQA